MVIMGQFGQWMLIVSQNTPCNPFTDMQCVVTAKSEFMVSGSADNTLRLWQVSTGKCLYTLEFPTAVKRVVFGGEKDDRIVCITEQRMGNQCVIRVFQIDRDDPKNRTSLSCFISYSG